ncbi:MAG TPA: hypothetical protein EYN79_09525 [Planctomycetes bacterium]|nr:hypothetical protein [Planctomycetota bacterium]HIN80086.1 hypothetical protein [Planctomycetota bacterium]
MANQMPRILIIGHDRDASYAMRNVFDNQPFELEICLGIAVAKSVLLERRIDLLIVDAQVCLEPEFDLIDFQIDHGVKIPVLLVGGENSGVRRSVRSKQGVHISYVDADGDLLLDWVSGCEELARA